MLGRTGRGEVHKKTVKANKKLFEGKTDVARKRRGKQ